MARHIEELLLLACMGAFVAITFAGMTLLE